MAIWARSRSPAAARCWPVRCCSSLARLTAPLTRPLARADYVAFAILGGTGLVTNTTLWYWGLQYTTALNAGILGAAAPIFVSVASALLFGDRLATCATGSASRSPCWRC